MVAKRGCYTELRLPFLAFQDPDEENKTDEEKTDEEKTDEEKTTHEENKTDHEHDSRGEQD